MNKNDRLPVHVSSVTVLLALFLLSGCVTHRRVPSMPIIPPLLPPAACMSLSGGEAMGTSGSEMVHIVEPGQDLTAIAMMYGVRANNLVEANSLSSETVMPGQKLVIPPAESTEPLRQSLERTQPSGGDRLLIKQASLKIEVDCVTSVVTQATQLTVSLGGFVQSSDVTGTNSARLMLRIPAAQLESVLGRLSSLGKETYRHISSDDVTGVVIDTEATLKNKLALRDRLRALIGRATDVKDIAKLEEQLTRLQTEIDSIQARLTSMKGAIQLTTIDFAVQQRLVPATRILGPLGYIGHGIAWFVEKLFVIR